MDEDVFRSFYDEYKFLQIKFRRERRRICQKYAHRSDGNYLSKDIINHQSDGKQERIKELHHSEDTEFATDFSEEDVDPIEPTESRLSKNQDISKPQAQSNSQVIHQQDDNNNNRSIWRHLRNDYDSHNDGLENNNNNNISDDNEDDCESWCSLSENPLALMDGHVENPLSTIETRVTDLRDLVFSDQFRKIYYGNSRDRARRVLECCEEKCHQVLTQLANMDWFLSEYDDLFADFHRDIEASFSRYNSHLDQLYDRRLELIINLASVHGHWLNLLSEHREIDEIITSSDRKILRYLHDIRFYYDISRESSDLDSNLRTQLLLFSFDKNPYFTNRTLMKAIYLDRSQKSGIRTSDGLYVTKVEGCIIDWLPGSRSLEDDKITRKQLVNVKTSVPSASFFGFFENQRLGGPESEYRVFRCFRDYIVPNRNRCPLVNETESGDNEEPKPGGERGEGDRGGEGGSEGGVETDISSHNPRERDEEDRV